MDPVEQVSIDTTQPEVNQVSANPNAVGDPAPSSDTAQKLASKTSFGLGDIVGKTPTELYQMYTQGQEQGIRQDAAAQLDRQASIGNVKAITDLANQKLGPLNLAEVQKLAQFPKTDPGSVVESAYAKQYMNRAYNAAFNIQDTWMDEAMEKMPDQVAKTKAIAEDKLTQREYAETVANRLADVKANQPFIEHLGGMVESMVPFYNPLKLQAAMEAVDGSLIGSILPGENLYQKTRALLRMPFPEFKDKFDAVVDQLKGTHLHLAQQFVEAVLGMSTSDRVINDVMPLVDTTVVAAPLIDSARLFNQMRTGFRQGVRGGRLPGPDAARTADTFGDAAEAAVQTVTPNLRADIDGVYRPTAQPFVRTGKDPISRATDSLPTGLKADKDVFSDDAVQTGSLSRELVTRIEAQFDNSATNIVDTIVNTAKVQRTGLQEATETQVRKVLEEVRNSNPTIRNMILDIGSPIPNPVSGENFVPVRLGNETGEQYSSEELARTAARVHGILEYDLKGKEGLRQYVPEAALQRPWETQSRLQEVRVENGEARIFTDGGVEVATTTRPALGHIPIEVKGTKVTFHPTIKSEDDLARATIEQQGLGFHLIVYKTLPENSTLAKDLLLNLDTARSMAGKSGFGDWLKTIPGVGYALGSDETLSVLERQARKTATFSLSNYHKMFQEEMRYINDVYRGVERVDQVTGIPYTKAEMYDKNSLQDRIPRRQVWKDFQRALEAGPHTPNPEIPGTKGYYYKTATEINHFWLSNFNRLPTFTELQGYLAWGRAYEMDRVLRANREATNKLRLAVEQHQFSVTDTNGVTTDSGFVEGTTRKELPGGRYPLLVVRPDGKLDLRLASNLGGSYKDLVEQVRSGRMAAIEVYNPERFPYAKMGLGRQLVRYVVAPKFEMKSLDYNDQVNRLSGGHFDYDFTHAVKQAKMVRTKAGGTVLDSYVGDTTVMLTSNPRAAEDFTRGLNQVMQLMVKKDIATAKALLKTIWPIEWKDWAVKFKETKNPTTGEMVPPELHLPKNPGDVFEPLSVVPKGRSIIDMGDALNKRYQITRPNGTVIDSFQDETKNGSLARQYQVGYTQERDSHDLQSLNVKGTKHNPIFVVEPAKFVDPITTMSRAINRIAQSTLMDDYKLLTVELFLREAGPWMKMDESLIRSAPFRAFHEANNPEAYKPGMPAGLKRQIMANRFKAQQFIGMPSPFDTFAHETAVRLAGWSYDTFGPKGPIVPLWMLNNFTNPVSILRSYAYQVTMGLFTPTTILTQAQSFATILAVAPRSAGAGTVANLLYNWSRGARSPGYLDLLDDWATKLVMPGIGSHRWKPGEWKEATLELERRGFAATGGGEHAPLDVQLNKRWVGGDLHAALEMGTVFFKGISHQIRLGAWYTAWKEARVAKPYGAFTEAETAAILDRADMMDGNMSRASASIMQSGVLSLQGQFLTYQQRLAELVWGKRLADTTGERVLARLRMLGIYWAIGGIGALGIAGLPISDYFRKAAIEQGYVVGDNYATTLLMEGPTSLALAWATGGGDAQKGNFYNLNNKLGASGLSQLKDMFKSDTPWWQWVGGASTSILANQIRDFSGFVHAMSSMMTNKPEDEQFPPTVEDAIDIFKEIAVVRQSWKAIVAANTGKWLSKNEAHQADVSRWNAVTMAVTGLNLQEADDNYLIGQILKDRKDLQAYALSRSIEEANRGFDAQDSSPKTSHAFFQRAWAWLRFSGYPEDKYGTAVSLWANGNETRIDDARWSLTKDAPTQTSYLGGLLTFKGTDQKNRDAYEAFKKIQGKKE